jgi:phage terminase large subunit
MDNRHYRATPMGIAKMLGVSLYPKQRDVLADCMTPGWTTLLAANESGKTTRIAAPLVLWFFLAFPMGKCVLTSGSWLQIQTQLFPAILAHSNKFEGWNFNSTDFQTRKGGECVAFSTKDPGRFEGHHSDGPDKPLLMILDEAKSISDGIFQAVERCRPTYLLIMSSSGLAQGFFFNSHTKDAKYWRRHVITAFDCPHISKQTIDRQIEKWGENHPLIRSMIYSEFVDTADGATIMIPLSLWNRAVNAKPIERGGECVAFMDFAAGGDENVLFIKRGNVMKQIASWREKDTMSAVGRFVIHLNECRKKYGLQAGSVFGDGSGLGKPMCDRLAEAGWEVNLVNNGAAANDSEHFANRAAEMWHEAKMLLERGELIVEDDPELVSQLTTRHFTLDSRGRIKLESKEDLRVRGLASPDRADAFIGAAASFPIRPFNYLEKETPWGNEPDLEEETPAGQIPGAYAGL